MAVKNNYECVMVFSVAQGDEKVQELIAKFKGIIEKDGTITSIDEWGKRKLAYLINDEAEGYYIVINFESAAELPAELDRVFKITDGVLRTLIIKK